MRVGAAALACPCQRAFASEAIIRFDVNNSRGHSGRMALIFVSRFLAAGEYRATNTDNQTTAFVAQA